jgi:hypothetical protein
MVTEGESCPVPDELIGRLYVSTIQEIDSIVSQLPPGPRGSLATFCYSRAHLRDIGLAIAATCDLETQIDSGGRAGTNLFEVSRERPAEPKLPYSWMRRSQISLASTAAA